jgi:hypothetical protein
MHPNRLVAMPDNLTAHRADLAVRILSPEMAAEKLGWTLEAVIARRATLGLPKFVAWRTRKPRGEHGRKGQKTKRTPRSKAVVIKDRRPDKPR